MNDPVDPAPAPTHLQGRFERMQRFQTEPYAEIVGEGSLTLADDGLHLSAEWEPTTRRVLVVLLALTLGVTAVVALCLALDWSNFLPFGVVLAAVPAIGLPWVLIRRRPYARVIPWEEVARPGISNDQIIFEVKKPNAGAVRFSMVGYGLAELRPLAQEIKRRSRAR